MAELALLMQAVATLAMVGLIWFVQVVHYPLFSAVGREHFAEYERRHQACTTWVVAPLMLAEAFTALLLFVVRPSGVSAWCAIAGGLLLAIVWLSTFLWQVPAHAKLGVAFDAATHNWLVRSNWVRTIGWTARGLLICWMIGKVFLHGVSAGASPIIAQLP